MGTVVERVFPRFPQGTCTRRLEGVQPLAAALCIGGHRWLPPRRTRLPSRSSTRLAMLALAHTGSSVRGMQRAAATAAMRATMPAAAAAMMAPMAAAAASAAPAASACSAAAAFHSSSSRSHNHSDWPRRSAQYFREKAFVEQTTRKRAAIKAAANQLPAVRVPHPHPVAAEGEHADMFAPSPDAADVDPSIAGLLTPASHFAVVRYRGDQFKVVEDDLVMLDRISGPNSSIGSTMILGEILLLGGRDATLVGRPLVPGALVSVTIEEHTHTAKVVVFKKKRRKGYKKKSGQRDMVTMVRVNKVLLPPGTESLTVGAPVEYATEEQIASAAKQALDSIRVAQIKKSESRFNEESAAGQARAASLARIYRGASKPKTTTTTKAASPAATPDAAAAATPAADAPPQLSDAERAAARKAKALKRFAVLKAKAKAKSTDAAAAATPAAVAADATTASATTPAPASSTSPAAPTAPRGPRAPKPTRAAPIRLSLVSSLGAVLSKSPRRLRSDAKQKANLALGEAGKAAKAAAASANPASASAAVAAAAASSASASPLGGVRAFSTLARRLPFVRRSSAATALPFAVSPALSASFSSAAAPSASTNEASIKHLLTSELRASTLAIEDTSGGCGAFFRLLVVSPAFEGLSLVKQHRLVNATLKPHIANLHGLTLTTFTEEQWKKQQSKQQA